MDLFLNERSLKEANHRKIAHQWMMNLMSVYKIAYSKGFKRLRTHRNIAGELLAPNYTISHWLNDKSVDQVIRLLFRSHANYPFIEDMLNQESDAGNRLFDFRYKKNIALGLGAACLFDSLAISLDNDPEWDATSILIHAGYFSEEENLTESEKQVKHCSRIKHLERLQQWMETVNKPSIPNGKIMWMKRKIFFPHLSFCKDVENQISHLHENLPEFVQIKKRLFEIETYCAEWETSPFNPNKVPSKLTPESDTRLDKFRDKLTIACPDQMIRLFSWHFRYTPGAGRLYIYPDEDNKKM